MTFKMFLSEKNESNIAQKYDSITAIEVSTTPTHATFLMAYFCLLWGSGKENLRSRLPLIGRSGFYALRFYCWLPIVNFPPPPNMIIIRWDGGCLTGIPNT